MSGPEGGTTLTCFVRSRAYPGATLGLGTSEVTSLPDYTAAKERARKHRLDRKIMARAAHIAAHVDTVRLDRASENILRKNLWELYR